MWGADDPDDRKPLLWNDLTYDDEVTHPFDQARRRDPVAPDVALREIYRALIALRQAHLRLFVDGALTYRLADDARGLLAYERALDDARAIVAFNTSDQSQTMIVDAENGRYSQVFPAGETLEATEGSLTVRLPAMTAAVWVKE